MNLNPGLSMLLNQSRRSNYRPSSAVNQFRRSNYKPSFAVNGHRKSFSSPLVNARSLKSFHKHYSGDVISNLTAFQDFVYRKELDILSVTETWLNNMVSDSEILPYNYTLFRRDRNDNRVGGVVLISLKSTSFKDVWPGADSEGCNRCSSTGQFFAINLCNIPYARNPLWSPAQSYIEAFSLLVASAKRRRELERKLAGAQVELWMAQFGANFSNPSTGEGVPTNQSTRFLCREHRWKSLIFKKLSKPVA